MDESVLNLGERIVLAARLGAIEHVKQALEAERSRSGRDGSGGVASAGDTDVAATVPQFVMEQWRAFYARAERGAA